MGRGADPDGLRRDARGPQASRRGVGVARRELEGAELRDAVYEALLELCPLKERDERFWSSRGLSRATMREGRFGSITAKRAHWAVKVLRRRFGEEKLLSVPGFSKKSFGRVSFTLTGDYP